jgi:hypothetical protein
MNKTLHYLPCLKHKEGLPTALTATNVRYLDIELCIIILNAVHIRVSTAFCVLVQKNIPTDISKLTQQLTRVCDQKKEHHWLLLNDLASRLGLKKYAS